MKKRLLTLLLALLITGSAVACSEKSAENTNTETAPIAENTAAESTEAGEEEGILKNARLEVPSSLTGNLDFGGEDMTILTRTGNTYEQEFFIEDLNGEIINDSLYERNLQIEEQLKVTIGIISRPGAWGEHTQFANDVRSEVMAGDDSYNLISFYAYVNPMLTRAKLFLNLYEIEHLNLEKPWWHQLFVDTATIYGKLFTVTGDIALTSITERNAMFFNKSLANNYLPEVNFYDLVQEGTWTIDTFTGLVSNLYSDLNANGKKDSEDLFGYNANGSLDPWPVGAGITYTKKTEDGGYEWNLNNERTVDIVSDFYAMTHEPGVYFDDGSTQDGFVEGHCIFVTGALNKSDTLRDMEDDYGILPMPKYDEAQEMYYSVAGDSYSQVSIPITCQNTAKVGAFMELAGELSYKHVTPAYFDTVMKGKYLRDAESALMLDLVIEGAWHDFGEINTSVLNNPVWLIRDALQEDDFASKYRSSEKGSKKILEKLLESYQD